MLAHLVHMLRRGSLVFILIVISYHSVKAASGSRIKRQGFQYEIQLQKIAKASSETTLAGAVDVFISIGENFLEIVDLKRADNTAEIQSTALIVSENRWYNNSLSRQLHPMLFPINLETTDLYFNYRIFHIVYRDRNGLHEFHGDGKNVIQLFTSHDGEKREVARFVIQALRPRSVPTMCPRTFMNLPQLSE